MIPFPGESVGCPDAWSSDGRGYFLSNDIEMRGTRNTATSIGHRVLAAGYEWRCWAYHVDHVPYLETGDPVPLAVSWVVEVLSGSGTLVVSDFHDDDWDESNTGPFPNALGTLNISGAGTWVMPTTSFSNDILVELGWDRGPAGVRLECTAGSIDIQQVKLRMWPVAGALGGWSAAEATESAKTINPSLWSQLAAVPVPDEPASQEEFRDDFATGTVASFASPIFSGDYLSSAAFTALHTEYDPEVAGNIHQYSGTPNFAYLRVNAGRLTGPGVEGVDWLRPPEEVQDEVDAVLFDGGPGSISWNQGLLSWLVGASAGGSTQWWYADGSFHVNIQEVSAFLASGTSIVPWVGSGTPVARFPTPGAASPNSHVLASFALPAPDPGQLYLLTFWHDGFLGDVEENWDGTFAGGSSSLQIFRGLTDTYPGGTLTLLQALWTPDPYHYWDPAVVPTPAPGGPPYGHFLDPNPNLDGLGDTVDVNFG